MSSGGHTSRRARNGRRRSTSAAGRDGSSNRAGASRERARPRRARARHSRDRRCGRTREEAVLAARYASGGRLECRSTRGRTRAHPVFGDGPAPRTPWGRRERAPCRMLRWASDRGLAGVVRLRSVRRPIGSSQKSQSSSSVASALPMTYDEPDPLKKSWFSSALGERADRIAGFTFVTDDGNIAS